MPFVPNDARSDTITTGKAPIDRSSRRSYPLRNKSNAVINWHRTDGVPTLSLGKSVESRSRRVSWKNRVDPPISLSLFLSLSACSTRSSGETSLAGNRRRDAVPLARDFSNPPCERRTGTLRFSFSSDTRARASMCACVRPRVITRNLEPNLGIFRGFGRTCAASSKKSDRSPFLVSPSPFPSLSLSLFRLFFPPPPPPPPATGKRDVDDGPRSRS